MAETALALLLYISSFRAMPKCPELSVLVKILAGERYNKDVDILSLNKLNQFWYFIYNIRSPTAIENSFEVAKKSACIIQLLKRPTQKPITFNFDFWLNLS